MSWPLAVSEWTLRDDDLDRCLARIAAAGYDAVELAGRPERPTAGLAAAVERAGLVPVSVCTVWSAARDYAHPDPGPRRAAVDYLRACLAQAGELGARAVVVVPTYRTTPAGTRDEELGRAAASIAAALDGHPPDGPRVAIEALNLYETHLVRTLDDAEELRRRIGHPAAGLMADVFHMHIEERSPAGALRTHARHLVHVHLADTNRAEPGAGRLDFAELASVLREIGYAGALALEFLPWTDDAGARGREVLRRALG